MAAYQFPDNGLQEISNLVSKITGDYMGLNQLYNPDETHTAAGAHAIKILKSLQTMQEVFAGVGTFDKLMAAIDAYNFEIQNIHLPSKDSNPLLSEVVQKSHAIVKGITDDPVIRVGLRKSILGTQRKENNDLIFPIQATMEINELIANTIKELESKNQGRSISVTQPAEKKTLFSKFFSSRSNKVMDASQIQRIPQAELDNTILFLKDIADQLPNPGLASIRLNSSIKHIINDLTKYIDDAPNNTSPFIHDALSRLTSGLRNYSHYLNDSEREVTPKINTILMTYIEYEFDSFLHTPAGKHYIFVVSGKENESPFKEQMNSDELDNFRDANFESNDKLDVLLTLLPEDQFEIFCERIADAYDRNYDKLLDESSAIVASKNKGPSQ